MQRILRSLMLLAALAATTVGLVACGDEAAVDESTDVDKILEETFSGDKKIDSGNLDVKIKLDVKDSGSSGVSGPVDVRLAGPFESQGKTKLPKLDLDLSFNGGGQSLKAGVTVLDDKGYVNFQGTDYVLSDPVFSQLKKNYEDAAAKSAKDDDKGASLATLGIDPRKWLTDPKNAGEAKVGDTDTIKVTGGVDVGKLLDDVNTALQKASSLGLSGAAAGQVPTKLTDEQKAQVEKAVKDVSVEIYTGKEDSTLRRMVVSLSVQDPEGKSGSADISLDLSLLDLNEEQNFEAPKDAKPFNDLLGQFGGGLGGLGGLGGAGLGSGSGSGSGSSGSDDSGSSSDDDAAKNLEKYTDCLETAGENVEEAQKCAELLTG